MTAGSAEAGVISAGLERALAMALTGLRGMGPDVGFPEDAQLLLAGLGEAAGAFAGEEAGVYSAAAASATAGADMVRRGSSVVG